MPVFGTIWKQVPTLEVWHNIRQRWVPTLWLSLSHGAQIQYAEACHNVGNCVFKSFERSRIQCLEGGVLVSQPGWNIILFRQVMFACFLLSKNFKNICDFKCLETYIFDRCRARYHFKAACLCSMMKAFCLTRVLTYRTQAPKVVCFRPGVNSKVHFRTSFLPGYLIETGNGNSAPVCGPQ